jgi:hypothetical protein
VFRHEDAILRDQHSDLQILRVILEQRLTRENQDEVVVATRTLRPWATSTTSDESGGARTLDPIQSSSTARTPRQVLPRRTQLRPDISRGARPLCELTPPCCARAGEPTDRRSSRRRTRRGKRCSRECRQDVSAATWRLREQERRQVVFVWSRGQVRSLNREV